MLKDCRLPLLFVAILLVHGCASSISSPRFPIPTSTNTVVQPSIQSQPAGTEPDPIVARPIVAATRLQAQANAAYEEGDVSRAVALLERAQRIAPRDGTIYRDMASAHRTAGREDLACQFARKGLSVPVEQSVAQELENHLDEC